MSFFTDQTIKIFEKVNVYLAKPKISEISQKKLLTELELALYFGRGVTWTANLRKEGVFMDKQHYFYLNGLVLYYREKIEQDIISGSLKT